MKKIKIVLTFFLLIIFSRMLIGQIGIGTFAPDPSAVLHVESINKGILFPKVSLASSTDAATITNPASGLIVFNPASTIKGPGMYINMGNMSFPQWEKYDYYDAASPIIKINKLIYSGATSNASQVLKTQFFEWRLIKTTSTAFSVQARLLLPPSATVSITGNSILWNSTSQTVVPLNTSWTVSDWNIWKNLYPNVSNNWDSAVFLNVSNDPNHFYKLGVHVQLDVYNLLVLEIL
jgi:hypothetical protein